MNNQKGITLIALVITIIVLIILAAVSIAMLTGDNGILTNAEKSRTMTNEASAADKINMELNAFKADILAEKDGKITEDTFTKAITALGSDYTITPNTYSGLYPDSSAPTELTISHKTYSGVEGKIQLKDSGEGSTAVKKGTITKATAPSVNKSSEQS